MNAHGLRGKKGVLNSTTPRTAPVKQSLIGRLLVTRCCKLSLPAALWAGSEVSEPLTSNDLVKILLKTTHSEVRDQAEEDAKVQFRRKHRYSII